MSTLNFDVEIKRAEALCAQESVKAATMRKQAEALLVQAAQAEREAYAYEGALGAFRAAAEIAAKAEGEIV